MAPMDQKLKIDALVAACAQATDAVDVGCDWPFHPKDLTGAEAMRIENAGTPECEECLRVGQKPWQC